MGLHRDWIGGGSDDPLHRIRVFAGTYAMINYRQIGMLGGLVVILLIAFLVRVHDIGGQSLWHDEGNTYVQTTRTFAEIADNASRDIHPPLYYWLITIWTRFMGDSETGLRSLSLFASLITVAVTYAIGKRLFGIIPAVFAMIFISLNTFSIYYAQEARMYALLALLGALAMWLFIQFIMPVRTAFLPSTSENLDALLRVRTDTQSDNLIPQRGEGEKINSPHEKNPLSIMERGFRGEVIFLALINTIGLYTHYSYPLIMLTQGILAILWFSADALRIIREKTSFAPLFRHIGMYIALNIVTIILFLPQLPTALNQLGGWGQADALLSPQVAIGTILAYLSIGITLGTGLHIAIVFFLLFALLQLPDEPRRMWWKVGLPAGWVALSVGIFLALGLYREANLKFLLPAQVGFALWMGRGVWEVWTLKPRRDNRNLEYIPKLAAGVGFLSVMVVFINGISPLYRDFRRDDYRQIATIIMTDEREGDAIILSAPNQAEVFRYYYAGNIPIYELPRGLGGDDVATADEMTLIINQHKRIFGVFWAQSERDPNNIVEGMLDSLTYEADGTWYGGVRLVRYVMPIEFADVTNIDIRFGDHIHLVSYALSTDRLIEGDVVQILLQWRADALIETRYKVFIQLLDDMGYVVSQRDAEPSAWNRPTITWEIGEIITDQHALIIPNDLTTSHYTLMVGLYNADNPQARLPVNTSDYFILAEFTLQ